MENAAAKRKARYVITPFTEVVDDVTRSVLEQLCPERKVVLHYSTGKDSLAAWLTLREMGFEVIPVYKEVIPNLEFLSKIISAHEKFFETEIHILPSDRQLTALYAQYGEQEEQNTKGLLTALNKAKKLNSRKNIDDWLLTHFGCGIAVTGTKGSDNLSRRTNFVMDGPYNAKRRTYSLCWRLSKNAPLRMLVEAKCAIPKYYLWLARSPEFLFDMEYSFIKEHYPDDWQIITTILPDAELRVKNFKFDDKARILAVPKIMREQYVLTQELFI